MTERRKIEVEVVGHETIQVGIVDMIRNGDRVTIETRHGNSVSGVATMRGPAGWVINTGGRHGTPAIASERNVVSIRRGRTLVWGRP